MACCGVLGEAEAAGFDAGGPGVIGEGGGDEVEGGRGGGVCEGFEQLGRFEVGPGPAVAEEEGYGVGVGGALVEEVKVNWGKARYGDSCVKLW